MRRPLLTPKWFNPKREFVVSSCLSSFIERQRGCAKERTRVGPQTNPKMDNGGTYHPCWNVAKAKHGDWVARIGRAGVQSPAGGIHRARHNAMCVFL